MSDFSQPNSRPSSRSNDRSGGRSNSSFSGTFNQAKSFARANDVLNGLVSNLGLDKRLREHTLMNLWPTLISQFFSERSRALFIDNESTLVIAVKDASCGQELTLLKPQLLPKLKSLATNLNLTIKNLRFELKHFHQSTAKPIFSLEANEPELPEPSDDELFSFKLKVEDGSKIEKLKADLSANQAFSTESSSETATKIIFLFEKQLRLGQWRKANNYPLCSRCQEAANVLHGIGKLCDVCYCASISKG